jgi:predicted neuraminidase
VGRSDSQDGGRSWSPLYLTDLPNNNSGLDLARLKDGMLALVCNPLENRRTPISVLLSSDNGRSWPRRLDLETDAGEYSYPAIISTEVGLAIIYTWKRERIAFWMGSVEQIPDGRG